MRMNILWIKDNNAGHEKQAEILLDELSKTREISIHDINIKGFHPFFYICRSCRRKFL